MAKQAVCRHCRRPIVLVLTVKGRQMPLDPDPTPDGNVWMDEGRARIVTLEHPAPLNAQRRMVHFATCTAAPTRRKKERNP